MKRELPVSLTTKHIRWGTRYLGFELVFLGSLLVLLAQKIWPAVPDAYLDFSYFLINFVAVFLIFRTFLWQNLQHTLKHMGATLTCAGIGYVVYWVTNFVISWAIVSLFPDFFNVNDASIAVTSQNHFWLMAAGTILLVPLAEEVLFRGLIFGSLHSRNRLLAYAISTVFFAFIHVMGYIGYYDIWMLLLCFVQYLPAGIALAWAYERSGSIYAPILIHTAVNAIGMLSSR